MGWISRGCLNAILVFVLGISVLAVTGAIVSTVEQSSEAILYLAVLVGILGGLWYFFGGGRPRT